MFSGRVRQEVPQVGQAGLKQGLRRGFEGEFIETVRQEAEAWSRG